MKKLLIILSIVSLNFLTFAQEAEITLPQVTTYIPSSVEQKIVLTAEDIEEAHYESLGQLVEGCGIQMLSYGPYGLDNKASIRGFTDETVRVVIDGICANNAQYGTFDLSSINLSAVEKIEIIRGGFTEGVEDEGAVGGVIYITMKKMELKNTLNADAALKTFFNSERPLDSVFQKLAFEGRLGESTFLNSSATINYAANRYFYKTDQAMSLQEGPFGAALTFGKNGGLYRAKSGYKKSQENAQVTDGHAANFLTHYFGNGNYISIGDIFYAGHKNTPGPVNSVTPGLQRDYNNNLSLTLWTPALAGGLFNLKNNIAWLCNNRFYKEQSDSEDSTHNINTIKYTASADFKSLAGGRFSQLVGFSYDYTKLDSTNDGNHFQISSVLKETSKLVLGDAGGKVGLWTFSLPLASKLCANDANINAAFVPKAGLAWQSPSGMFGLFADGYRMVQFPNMDDLFWEGSGFHGNPNLKPESGWGADLGITVNNVQLSGGKTSLNGSLTIFSDYYKDKIKWGTGTTENLASAFYLGVDFAFGAKFKSGLISLDVNGEYLYNRLLDKDNEYTYGKRIMWTPDFVCTTVFGLNFELAKIKLSATYTGRRYTSNMNIYYLQPYVLMNLAAETAPVRGKFTPYLKVENLLNWQYQSVDGYSMPGISLTLGAKYKFF